MRAVDVIALGVGATLITDLWGALLKRAFTIPAPNYCLVGRWLHHMPSGVFRHGSIAAARPKSGECVLGWVAHYAIGIAFAMLLAFVTPAGWLTAPTMLPAVTVGLATVILPYFVMQPAFGLGVAAAKTPKPAQARLRSLMTHAAFGFGLYLSGLILSSLL